MENLLELVNYSLLARRNHENETNRTTGKKYPIIQGPMAWITDAKLALAVGEAGGAGVIACGSREPGWVREEINKIRKATDKVFGLNLVMMDKNKEAMFKLALEEKVPLVTLSAGNPLRYIEPLKNAYHRSRRDS
jgi:enoyl-[acyl-carrier protein] reductase II